MSVGGTQILGRLACRQEGLEHALLDHRHRLGFHSFKVERIIARERLALIGSLRRIVHHIDPLRQNARAGASFEFARDDINRAIGIGNRFAGDAQIVAQQLRQ